MKKANKKIKSQRKNNQKQQINLKLCQNSSTFKISYNQITKSKQITLHHKYSLYQNDIYYSEIDKLMQLLIDKQSRKDKKIQKIVQYTNFPTFEFELLKVMPSSQKCSVCNFQFQISSNHIQELQNQNPTDILQLKCKHLFHFRCLQILISDKQWIKCPSCLTVFGIMIGDQTLGEMNIRIDPFLQCQGYPKGTIIIQYKMESGYQGDIHFSSTKRTAYLPNTAEGKQILKLLKIAFERKLIFTIGTSITTGIQNKIIWNGIHHKTRMKGGASNFGYPDPTYFEKVKLQLAAKGIY